MKSSPTSSICKLDFFKFQKMEEFEIEEIQINEGLPLHWFYSKKSFEIWTASMQEFFFSKIQF